MHAASAHSGVTRGSAIMAEWSVLDEVPPGQTAAGGQHQMPVRSTDPQHLG